MATRDRSWPDIAIPPGETLAEEIAARGLSQSELARQMGRPVQAINEIINGKKEITAQTALDLERVLGISGQFWVRLDADYQYNKERIRRASAAKRTRVVQGLNPRSAGRRAHAGAGRQGRGYARRAAARVSSRSASKGKK